MMAMMIGIMARRSDTTLDDDDDDDGAFSHCCFSSKNVPDIYCVSISNVTTLISASSSHSSLAFWGTLVIRRTKNGTYRSSFRRLTPLKINGWNMFLKEVLVQIIFLSFHG